MILTRRSFLQITGSALAALAVPAGTRAFAEPIIQAHPAEWIIDKGDYYEVYVPERKKLSREHFDKPIVLFMGLLANFVENSVEGFTTVYSAGNNTISDCRFDITRCVSTFAGRKAAITFEKTTSIINSCVVVSDNYTANLTKVTPR